MNLGRLSAAIRKSGNAGLPIIGFGMASILCIIKITFIEIQWSGTLSPILASIAIAQRFPDLNSTRGPQRLKPPSLNTPLSGTSGTRALPDSQFHLQTIFHFDFSGDSTRIKTSSHR